MDFFSQDWPIIKKSSSHYSNDPLPPLVDSKYLKERLYEIDIEEEQNVKADEFCSELLKPTDKSKAHIDNIKVRKYLCLSFNSFCNSFSFHCII